MIEKIIHSADWQLHKNNENRQSAFLYTSQKYFELLSDEIIPNKTIQVIAGDLYENFNDVSNEAFIMLLEFLKKCLEFSPLVVIPGNHDYDEKNPYKKNILQTLSVAINDINFYLYEEETCYLFDNIVFVNYCHYTGSNRPKNINEFREKHKNKIFVGLYHDPIQNAKTLNHDFNSYSKSLDIFKGCDFVIAGDIHLRQYFKYGENNYFVYSGSPYQLTHGENITNHGVVVWNVNDFSFKFKTLESPYNFINIKLSGFNDLSELYITNI